MDMKHLAIRIGPHHSQQTYINTAEEITTQQPNISYYLKPTTSEHSIRHRFFVPQQSTSNRHEDYIM